MSRPGLKPGVALGLAIFAVSWGSILVRFCAAPPLVIAFYRLGFATLFLLPFVAIRHPPLVRRPDARTGWLGLAAGFLLALHFGVWITSLAFTTVASSVVLVSTQPIFSALFSGPALGEKAPGRLYLGVAVCLAGTALIAGADFSLSLAHLKGDLLALAGAAAAAGYFVVGRSVRAEIPFWNYLLLVYGSAAVVLGLAATAARNPILENRSQDYFWFFVMALVPSLVGHSCFNWAVRHLRVYHVNLAAFGEPILASLYAFLLFGERLPPSLWAGAALVFGGVIVSLPPRGAPVPPADEAGGAA